MPRDPRGGSARSRRAAGGARSGPGPIQRLNEHLTRAFFDGRAELLREEEFDGDFRELARLANVFLRATRRAVDSARAAEGAVREREGRLALVLEASRDAIVAFDRSGRVLFANPAWVERSGFAPESVTRIPFELVAAEDRETFRAKVAAAFEGTPFRASYRAETRDGGERWISGQWSPLRDDKGTVAGIVGVERDDTQHREAEERHRTARRLESLGRLAGGIAHDFNNLLTVFSVQLDALRERLRDDPRARESLLPMEAAAARGADLVRQLLMFGRRAPADRSRVDLRTPLRETLDLLRRTVGDAYRIECEMPAEPLTVEGDRSQLAQVVLNLCLNARDAMEHGGTIRVRAATEAGDPSSGGDARRAVLEVADHGVGIAPSDRDRVFEPFFTTKEPGRGTGLGLALVHEIVQRHGGTVGFTSAVGRGSCFRVTLPLTTGDDAPEAPRAVRARTAPRREATVLVVESDDEVRGVLRGSLEREGHRVFTARDPREALALAEGTAAGFDVLLTNPSLPDLSGAELARRLAQRDAKFATIFSTGARESANGRRGGDIPRGARVLPKPFSVGELRDAIRLALDERDGAAGA